VIINAGCGICTFSIHVCVHIFLTYSAWDDDHLLPGTQTYKLCEPPHALLVSYSFQCSDCILIHIYISKIRKFERERERESESGKGKSLLLYGWSWKVYLYADPGFLSIARCGPIRGHCRLNAGVP
jgi:hypothetical protein